MFSHLKLSFLFQDHGSHFDINFGTLEDNIPIYYVAKAQPSIPTQCIPRCFARKSIHPDNFVILQVLTHDFENRYSNFHPIRKVYLYLHIHVV